MRLTMEILVALQSNRSCFADVGAEPVHSL